jgi:pimeloyl-ACP methyl ester carboxylesterase
MTESQSTAAITHSTIEVDGYPIHLVTAGATTNPAVLLLHGWPQTWQAFAQIIPRLATVNRVVAMDLPGIGVTGPPPAAGDKRSIAKVVRRVMKTLRLTNVTLVGHDVGGMVTYAFLRAYQDDLTGAIIMNTVIPGITPWAQVIANPHIWHFAFHAVPKLPEQLVAGGQAAYFDYFFDAISEHPEAIDRTARAAYADAYGRVETLRAGFDWYRGLAKDEQDNAEPASPVSTPVLYVRGECEAGRIETYVNGLRSAGLANLRSQLIPDSGHFAPEEQPAAVADAILAFQQERV